MLRWVGPLYLLRYAEAWKVVAQLAVVCASARNQPHRAALELCGRVFGNLHKRDATSIALAASIHRLHGLDGGRSVRWNRDQRKLINLGLAELDPAIVHEAVFQRAESDRHTTHQLGLDGLPRHVNKVFQGTSVSDSGDGRGKWDALLCRLAEYRSSHGLVVLVLPQQRQLIRELRAHRINDIAHAIRLRCGRNARDRALVFVNRLDRQNRISAIRFHLLPHC